MLGIDSRLVIEGRMGCGLVGLGWMMRILGGSKHERKRRFWRGLV